jgi:integral membrane protein
MDPKVVSALRRLRLVSAPEAVSFLLLLVAPVLKRTTEFNAVPVLGAVHGVLFIGYVLCWLDAWRRVSWPLRTAAWYLLMSVLPAGGLFAERRLRGGTRGGVESEADAGVARPEGVVSA